MNTSVADDKGRTSNRYRMLIALRLSKNKMTSAMAAYIMDMCMDSENYSFAGGFMEAVMDGDIKRATILADDDNLYALRRMR